MIFSEHGGGSGSVGVGGRFEVDTQSRDSGHSSGGLSYETGGGNQGLLDCLSIYSFNTAKDETATSSVTALGSEQQVWPLTQFFSVSFL